MKEDSLCLLDLKTTAFNKPAGNMGFAAMLAGNKFSSFCTLSAAVRADGILFSILFLSSTSVILLGFSSGLDVFQIPAQQQALIVGHNCGIIPIQNLSSMFKTFLKVSLIFFFACKNITQENTSQHNGFNRWRYLRLELRDTVINLDNAEDSFEVVVPREGVIKYQITKTEKDSLFVLANELLDFNGQPKLQCTDYVGKLKVTIRYNEQLVKEISFTSICNWRELNSNTRKIAELLKKI